MTFQAAGALQGVAGSAADLLPSLSGTLAAPWQLASRLGRTGRSKKPQPAVTEKSSDAQTAPSETAQASGDNTQAMFNEALDIITSHPRFQPSRDALKQDYSVQGILAAAGRDARHMKRSSFARTFQSRPQRHYSTTSSFGPFTLRSPSSQTPSHSKSQTRTATSNHTSQNLLAHMEQTANNNPTSASAQNGFYSALLRANMPEILVERYETGRYATNAACDAMYHRALERLDQTAGTTQPSTTGAGLKGLSNEQLHAVSRAVVASQRGSSSASARGKGATGTGAKESPLHVVVDESTGSYIFRILKFVLIYGLVGYFALVIVTFAIEASGVLRRVGGPQNAEIKPEQQKTRFADVKGCDEAIEELHEIVDFLKSPDKYNQLGGKLPKGVLMIGPPGTGKTLLARAVAGEAGVPFFYMSGSEFDEVYVGVGAKRVRELFSNAKAKAPAIVFIDELDAVGGKRNERDAAYHMQTLNQMLTELDGFDQTSGVVFIGATNFPQMLDKALTRPGRFDRQIVVPLPDVRGRMAILDYHIRNMQMGPDVDVGVMARGTPGFSGADLENLVNQAAIRASKAGAQKVRMLDMDWARDRIIMGAEKKSMVVQDKDKLMTAYHEAGHALMCWFTAGADPLYKITIMPRGQALGITSFMPDMDKVSHSKRECLAQIDVSMGGKIAEELIYGVDEVTSGCSSDLAQATRAAYTMVTQYGMSDALGSIAFNDRLYDSLSPETKHRVEAEVRRILDESLERTRKLLTAKKKELELLAHGLLKYETLTKEEMEKVITGEELPDKLQALAPAPLKIPEIPLPGPLGQGAASSSSSSSSSGGASDESGGEPPSGTMGAQG